MNNNTEITKFMNCVSAYSPQVFINERFELIVIPSKNIYFRLEDVESKRDLQVKILTWLSRAACKGVGSYWETRMRKIINIYLNTNFDKKDFSLIYTRLGNGVNPDLCHRFIDTNFDLSVLEDEC